MHTGLLWHKSLPLFQSFPLNIARRMAGSSGLWLSGTYTPFAASLGATESGVDPRFWKEKSSSAIEMCAPVARYVCVFRF